MPGIYYPAALVTLQVRLEEFGSDLPKEALEALDGIVSGGMRFIPGTEGWNGQGPASEPGIVNKAMARTFMVQAIPSKMTIRKNSYREADECTVSVRYQDLPMDPDFIRSIGVAAYLGTVPADTWGRAMEKGVSLNDRVDGKSIADLLAVETSLRFGGFADEVNLDQGESGDELSFTARDWTSILLDLPVPTAVYKEIDWAGPIEEVVLQVLASVTALQDVWLHVVGFEPGTVRAGASRQQVGGSKGLKARRSPKAAEETYWDLLTDLSVMNGLVMYADIWQGPNPESEDGDELRRPLCRFVLARPLDVFSSRLRKFWQFQAYRAANGKLTWHPGTEGFESDFQDRDRVHPITGAPLLHPLMVYGHNVETMTKKRRLGRIKTPSIRAVCFKDGKPLAAVWPDTPRATKVHPSGLWASNEERVMVFPSARSEAELKVLAQQAFEEVGRGDKTLTFTTCDLATFGGDNLDPDALELRPGSPVEVLYAKSLRDGSGAVGSVQDLAAMSEGDLRDYLIKVKGLSVRAATSLAWTMKGAQVQRGLSPLWYTRSVEHSWSSDDGYSLSVEAVNYVQTQVRRDVAKAEGTSVGSEYA